MLFRSPLLASRTPVWRSKLVVGAIALAFLGLGVRAAYIQVFANGFFQRQGEVRFARTLDIPATRGRILDRNGLVKILTQKNGQIVLRDCEQALLPFHSKGKRIDLCAQGSETKVADDGKGSLRGKYFKRFDGGKIRS